MPVDDLVSHLRDLTFEHSLHLGHPAFFAYICGAGTVPGAATELLAAGLNPCLGGYRLGPGAAEIELHLTRWLAERFGLPEGAGGMIMTGGAMANFVGLKCARDQRLGLAVREEGVRGRGPVGIYASDEAHVVIRRAADMLGLGASAVRAIAVDGEQRMRPDALAAAIERDVADGVLPLAVCGTAGTTTTGSIDPLPALADLAAEHGAWFHVDAAYGGAAVLSDELRGLLDGIGRADSLAVDPHKWLYTSQSAGCVLVRDFGHLSRSFHADASYIWLDEAARHGIDFAMHGPQFSRGFAALKVWVSLLAHGRAAYGKRIAHDAALARYLGELVEEHPEFELMCEPRLSICCFRYRPRGWSGTERGAGPAQRAAHDRDPRRRPRLLLQRGDRRPLRPARLHRELPYRGPGRRPPARRRDGARTARAGAGRGLRASGPCGSCGRSRTPAIRSASRGPTRNASMRSPILRWKWPCR